MKKPAPITDPLTHAKRQTGKAWTVLESRTGFEAYGAYETTGAFDDLDGGYKRHCGPTAITNLLLTLENRSPVTAGKRMAAPRVFRRVARYGEKKHYYLNASLLGIWGGTFNVATKAYIRRALAMYRRGKETVSGPRSAIRPFLKHALDRGELLYLELVLHPVYGNHHLLVYGYRLLQSTDGHLRLYLLAADGWNGAPRYLFERDLILSRFYAVSPGEERPDYLRIRRRTSEL